MIIGCSVVALSHKSITIVDHNGNGKRQHPKEISHQLYSAVLSIVPSTTGSQCRVVALSLVSLRYPFNLDDAINIEENHFLKPHFYQNIHLQQPPDLLNIVWAIQKFEYVANNYL
ncbi:hypothetical protein TNCV_1720131 [Trichonephila clavipes]|nr:hypothetical protein TNCV_1720131 [Trichonephila clavipes]